MFEGIHLTGGGALLRGMTQRLADATAVPVHLVDTPLECVVQGAGVCLESFDRLKRLFSRGRLGGSVPKLVRERSSSSSAAAWRTCQSRSAAADRVPARPGGRRSRPARRSPAAGPSACRPARRARPASPAGSPMAPSAATAASRQRTSPCPVAVATSAGTAGRHRRSARNQAAPTTTSGSGSASAAVTAAGSDRARAGPRTPARPRRRGDARTGDPVARAAATSSAVSAPRRASAPERRRLDAGVGIAQATPGRSASPRWPGERDAAPARSARRSAAASVAGSSLTVPSMSDPTRPPTGKPRRPLLPATPARPRPVVGAAVAACPPAAPAPALAGLRGGPRPHRRRRLDRRPRHGQLLRDHAGRRHAGRPVHRGAAARTTTR